MVWASLRGRGSPYCPYRPKHRSEAPGQVPPEGLDSTLPVPLPHGLTMAALPSICGSVYSAGNGVERPGQRRSTQAIHGEWPCKRSRPGSPQTTFLGLALAVMRCLCRQRRLKREVEKHKLFEDYLMKVLEKIPKGTYGPSSLLPLQAGDQSEPRLRLQNEDPRRPMPRGFEGHRC